MDSIREAAEKLWRGATTTAQPGHHPLLSALHLTAEICPDVAFYKGYVNLVVVQTEAGLVLIDTGSYHPRQHWRSFEGVRCWSKDRVHTAVYTHGHVDHAYGLPPFLREIEEKHWARPQIISHRAVIPGMQRYIATSGYNTVINTRQFGGARFEWPTARKRS